MIRATAPGYTFEIQTNSITEAYRFREWLRHIENLLGKDVDVDVEQDPTSGRVDIEDAATEHPAPPCPSCRDGLVSQTTVKVEGGVETHVSSLGPCPDCQEPEVPTPEGGDAR